MHKKFDHQALEQKWQTYWKEHQIYSLEQAKADSEKEYVLVEWPYPSGNLHVGHWYAFAVPDIYVRMRRMQGVKVLYPMGFDAFGLPAENAAIKNKVNPREWTEQNIQKMHEQLDSMGASFTSEMTANSTDPEYYKWTQWMFAEFFKNDIAYRGVGIVNWCPGCNTVIANEQVLPDGTCERCKSEVEKREMPQWMIRITNYADRLIDDLDTLDWPEHIKEAQRQWIGRSEGAEIDFTLSTEDTLTVFTTRPDTLYGVTYMVLAPEHPLLEKNQANIQNYDEVAKYIKESGKKDEYDRLDAKKEKTGVKLEGITATNPANGEEIPVYIADYVLMGYGTGAIMAVPAHDERDYEFALKYDLPIKQVVGKMEELPYIGVGELIASGDFNSMDSEEAKLAIVKKVSGRMTNTYRLRDWSIGRQRYWGVPIPIVYDPEGKAHPVPIEHLPWTLPEDVDFTPTGEPPLKKSRELHRRTEEIFGAGWTPEVETMDTFVDSSWYFLRYIDNQNDQEFASKAAQEEWMPIDIYFGGAEHTTMHLLYSRFWQKALYDLGLAIHQEPYKRRINRGLILGPDGDKMSKSKGNVVDPDEHVKTVGSDTVRTYLGFMGPYEGSNYPFDLGGIAGMHRFLERVNGLSGHIQDTEEKEVTSLLHKTIKKVSEDVEQFKFNTAISAMMIFLNKAEKVGLTKETYQIYLQLLAPFAPHLADELWELAGHDGSIHSTTWPTFDQSLIADEEVTIGVQINGKHRGDITISPEADEETAMKAVKENEKLASQLPTAVARVIYKPGKILNIVGK